MSTTKIITCVNDYYSASVTEQLSLALNVEFIDLSDISQLFRVLSNNSYHTDAILIDIEKLSNYDNVGLLDMIMTLKTVATCSCSDNPNVISIPIGITVNNDTDAKLIKEVLSTGYIIGIYPSGVEFTLEEKILALDSIIKNQSHIPEPIRKRIHEKKKSKRLKKESNNIDLTQRQQQILDLIISKGASNKLIARILNISESTVKLHMTHILKKYSLTNRTQLALFCKTQKQD